MKHYKQLQTMDYFSARPENHIFTVMDIFTNGIIRGRLTYLYNQSIVSNWKYERVSTRNLYLLDSKKYEVVCNMPDAQHANFDFSQINAFYPAKRINRQLLLEDSQLNDLIENLIKNEPAIRIGEFGIIGSRLFRQPNPSSDIDLVFYSLIDKEEALKKALITLQVIGVIERIPIEEDSRFVDRLGNEYYSTEQMNYISEMQWFRKYYFKNKFMFNLSFSNNSQIRTKPITHIGRQVEFLGRIVNAKDSFISPYEYLVEDLQTKKLVRISTYNWAFRHCGEIGDDLLIRGSIAENDDEDFLYINKSDEFLKPVLK